MFGVDVGTAGMLIQPHDHRAEQTANEVLNKAWPDDFRKRMGREFDPLMLIISIDFAKFSPEKHPWAVIWFSEHEANAKDIPRLCHSLAIMARNNEDIFAYIRSISRKQKLKKIFELAKLAKVGKYFESARFRLSVSRSM